MRILQATILALAIILIGAGTSFADDGDTSSSVNLLSQVPAPIIAASVLPDPEPEPASQSAISDLMNMAFENNPQIASARANWQAMTEMYPQATSLPDPKLNVSWFPQPIETRNGSNDFGIQLMEMIPNPHRLDVMGDIALTKAEMARVNYEKTVRGVLTRLMSSWFELGYLHSAIDIAETNLELFSQLVDLGNLRYAQGEIGASELYAAQSRFEQASYESMLLTELLRSEESNMRSILGVDSDFDIGEIALPEIDPVALDLDNLKERVLEYRHELEMAGIAVEIADLGVSLARSMDDPDYSVGLMYNFIGRSPMSDGMLSSGDDAWGVMFGVSLPIWSGKNRAQVDQAEANLNAARADLENRENMAENDVERLYWRIQNQGRLVTLYRDTLLPDAVNAAELAETWFEQEQISFTELIETRMVVQNFELATARAQADYLDSLVELQSLTGIPVFGDNQEEVS